MKFLTAWVGLLAVALGATALAGAEWQQAHSSAGFVNAATTFLDGDSDGMPDHADNCAGLPNPLQKDEDADGNGNECDNCPMMGNTSQADFDGDAFGDACDDDDDNDKVFDVDEPPCGGTNFNASLRPERLDPPFAGVDDDGDTLINEALPPGSAVYDCDGDGYVGTAEAHVFAASGGIDQDACGTDAWPADLTAAGGFSANKVNISDVAAYVGVPRYFNTNVGTSPGDVRYDVVPGSTFGSDINIMDLQSVAFGTAPMVGGVRMFNGPTCPWPP